MNIYLTCIINILPITSNSYTIIITPIKITNSEYMHTIYLFNKDNCDNCYKYNKNKKIPYYSKNIYLCNRHFTEIEHKFKNFLEPNISYQINMLQTIKDINYTYNTDIDLTNFETLIYS